MSQTNSLYTLDTAGNAVPATADQIIAAAREQISRRVRRGSPLSSPKAEGDSGLSDAEARRQGFRNFLSPLP